MVRNRSVMVIITELQNQLILNKTKELNYKNKSAFVRDRILSDDFAVERMVTRIHELICKRDDFGRLK